MKIVSSGRVLNSREFYKKKKRRNRIKLILIFIVIVSAITYLIYLSRQERFQITGVEVLGENIVDREEMIQKTEQLLNGYYLWLIPRYNTFFYPKGGIKFSLLADFPRLKSVNLKLDESKKLNISVEERAPFALYCDSTSSPRETIDCYFLDSEGFIFALAPSFSRGVYFVYTGDMIEKPIGQWLVNEEEFQSLLSFIKRLGELNIAPVGLDFSDGEYTLVLPSEGKITLRRGSDLAQVYTNLEAFLNDDSIKSQTNFLDKILYLDLRSENKVFYKFRN